MKRILLLSVLSLVATPLVVSAQGTPDIRDIAPTVVLLVDTSGSMERRPDCVCSTALCEECLPLCGTGGVHQRNRWTMLVEALTGTYQNFQCTAQNRWDPTFAGEYDHRYYIPHHRIQSTGQLTDGILDSYAERVRFGLMTFDAVSAFTDTAPAIPRTQFEARLADNTATPGMYSYGETKPFTFPGCGVEHMMDNGVRNESAADGPMISTGVPGSDNYLTINQQIQAALQDTRPFGATPIAGMLDDFRYYLRNHPHVRPIANAGDQGDPYAACRKRFAILISDGYPNADMRGAPFNCDSMGFSCPYQTPEQIASDLCQYNLGQGACTGEIDGLFVVGFAIEGDANAKLRLDAIASAGGTSHLNPDGGAFLANDPATLMQRLSEALDLAQPGTTTRVVPAFASSSLSSSSQSMFQFNAGFRIPGGGRPWQGVLERRRWTCEAQPDGPPQPTAQPVSASEGDLFHENLNDQNTRTLYTVIPGNVANATGHIAGVTPTGIPSLNVTGTPTRAFSGGNGSASCGANMGTSGNAATSPVETGRPVEEFNLGNANITNALLGVANDAEREQVINWVLGAAGSGRETLRLGDVYHSSPVVVGAPEVDRADEGFNTFRNREEVRTRPTVVYVGTNDGVLHAFAAEAVTVPAANGRPARTLAAGEEIWGFIPPMLLPKLRSASISRQWMVDGTPVVRDVFYRREPNSDSTDYATVLIVGMRGGGNGYIALDVTDPVAPPKFLWQFSHPDMGQAYGQAGLGHLLVETSGLFEERAFAILPGGLGQDRTSICGAPVSGCVSRGRGPITRVTERASGSAADNMRCFGELGRNLYIVDVATGELFRHYNSTYFGAPLVGGISMYPGDVATAATRAYFTDANGILWRMNFGSKDPEAWEPEPLHDIFYDVARATDRQPGLNPPLVSVPTPDSTTTEAVVVIQATGNIDDLESTVANRVVSISELVSYGTTGNVVSSGDPIAKMNWEIRLTDGEQVTGPLDLFNQVVYFGSFVSSGDPTNACSFGYSRIWGVDYKKHIGTSTDPEGRLVFAEDESGNEIPADNRPTLTSTPPIPNAIVMGVSVARQPTCFDVSAPTETDPYVPGRAHRRAGQAGGGGYRLVGLLSGANGSGALGGSVVEFNRAIQSPVTTTVLQSYAGSLE